MTKRVLILVEGQTEERFVKDILAPEFYSQNLYLIPTILNTKKVKNGPNFKGGVTNFSKFKNDVNRLLSNSGGALVTTMLDYYKLPGDFPGMDSRPDSNPLSRVKHVENRIKEYFNNSEFLPFLVLHEFEALLFSSEEVLPRVMTDMSKKGVFSKIITQYKSPEEINERPGYNPSSCIISLFPDFSKLLHGPITAGRIGLSTIRSKCHHFSNWINYLEQFAKR